MKSPSFGFVLDGQCGGTGASLQVRSGFSTNPAAFPPVVCGQLSGQHSNNSYTFISGFKFEFGTYLQSSFSVFREWEHGQCWNHGH